MDHLIDSFYHALRSTSLLEAIAVVAGLVYVVLAARENIWCWFFGLINGLVSVILFYRSQLFAESFLYLYYVWAAVYGWWSWIDHSFQEKEEIPIVSWKVARHLKAIGLVALAGLLLGAILDRFTPAAYPWIDSQTTVFSFWATYLVTRKVLENWVYWVVIDFGSIFLYGSRGLYLYAFLMVLYTGMAVWGWMEWRRLWRQASQNSAIKG